MQLHLQVRRLLPVPHLPAALERLGMTFIGWTKSARDGGNRRVATLNRLPELASSDSVVMLHDALPRPENRERYLEQLARLFDRINEQKLKTVGVEKIFEIPAYHEARG